MPPPRPELTPSRGPEEKNPREAQPSKGDTAPIVKPVGAWKAWLPLGVTIVVMPLLAYGMATFILVPKMQKTLVASGVVLAKENAQVRAGVDGVGSETLASGSQRQVVTLNKLLVNVAGTMASRYLLPSITLVSDASDFSARVKDNEPQLRDMACGLMMMKTIAILEQPGARNLLRGELIAGFNTILGNAAVRELYFTEFAIQ